MRSSASLLHLRAADVSLVLDLADGLPRVLHWGADLGDLTAIDAAAVAAALSPAERPSLGAHGLTASRNGRPVRPELVVRSTRLIGGTLTEGLVQAGPDTLLVEAADDSAGIVFDLAVQLTAAGLVRCRAGVTNVGPEPLLLGSVELLLPAGPAAVERVDLEGAVLRRSRLGAASTSTGTRPMIVAEPGASFRSGEVWQFQVSFSGGTEHRAETAAGLISLGGGERLDPAEVVLDARESYQTPWLVWSWGDGLDEAAGRIHRQLRSPDAAPRPVIFDASGPSYADDDRAALLSLAEYAAAVGAEVFLLDLDWCVRAGLDPYADTDGSAAAPDAAPDDLDGLLGRLRDLDLRVGLAIRPEELEPGAALTDTTERLAKLIDRYALDVISWPLESGVPHAGTLAVYRLLDALRERHPQLQIYSTGADLALASRAGLADRSADSRGRYAELPALLQQLPPELVWQPVADEPEDQTSPVYRAVSAFFAQLGLGLDLRRQQPASLRAIHRWIALYKELRPLLHGGDTVRSEASEPGFLTHGVVAPDQQQALFAAVWHESSSERRLRLDGLDPRRRYQVRVVGARPGDPLAVNPAWAGSTPVLPGSLLAEAGLPLPSTGRRGSALLLHLVSA